MTVTSKPPHRSIQYCKAEAADKDHVVVVAGSEGGGSRLSRVETGIQGCPRETLVGIKKPVAPPPCRLIIWPRQDS